MAAHLSQRLSSVDHLSHSCNLYVCFRYRFQRHLFGTAVALLNVLVRFSIVILLIGFTRFVALGAEDDPFAAYHKAIEGRIEAMSGPKNPVSKNEPESFQPSDDKARSTITVSDFSRRFWRGRDAAIAAALSRLEKYRLTMERILQEEAIPKGLIGIVLVESPGLAKAIGTLLKQDFQRAMLNRIPKMERYRDRHWREVLFLCDEYHSFATVGENDPSGDEKFFALSRQAKCIPIVATQSISSLRSTLPGE